MEAAALYAGGRARVSALVGALPATDLDRPVPSTPGWTVKDVVGHLVGVAADVSAGRVDGTATPAWTARQVDDRRGVPLGSVLAEWASFGPGLEAMLTAGPRTVANRLVCDLACHEHDLRGALHRAGARDAETVDFALQTGVGYLHSRLRHAKAGGLRLRAGSTEWIVGTGDPAATLSAAPFDLFRLLFGRRSKSQMTALEWAGDGARYLEHLSLFPPAAADLTE